MAAGAPWHHARSRASELFSRTIRKCLPFQFQLFCVLFIYYGVAFFEIWKGIIKGKLIPKVGWLRASTPDCGSLCLWLASPSRWPDRWPPSEPLWPLGWDFELTSPISGWKIFLWLCYVLRPLERSASSSSLPS